MIDIYDELGYIKNVLSDGLSQKWERDATLLTRYYKMDGIKKSEAKKRIQQKCEEAAHRENNPITYNHLVSYKRLNKIVDGAWKKDTTLRAIHGVTISKEVVDWFLNLETNTSLTDEEVAKYKKRRPNITIKKNNPMNWNRVKYLFTLYIWTKIQENYLDRPQMHYLKKFYKRFKEDAKLPASFSMQKERDFLYDLGYIDINYALGIETSFIEKYDVFKIPVTEENGVFIPTGEPPEGDLYNPGYWLEKQKMGSFTCQCCGKEFAYNSTGKNAHKQKYCKECANKVGHGKIGEDTKTIFCIDCGIEVSINKRDGQTCRCAICQSEHIKRYDRDRKSNNSVAVQDFTESM